jgi:hypothetical protein
MKTFIKSRRTINFLQQIEAALGKVEATDFRGDPYDDGDVAEHVKDFKKITYQCPDTGVEHQVFGTDLAAALIKSENLAKCGEDD